MAHTIDRHVRPRVIEALQDTRVVVVQGARQVGKTTLIRDVVDELGGRLVTFDDEPTRASAQADPVGFLMQNPDGLLAVDEVQRVPELVLALKLVVDRDPRPGRFLVTGSADLLRLPAAQDSLAGRAESIELHGFSQGEIVGRREAFIDRLFSGEVFTNHDSELVRHDYLERALAGGYPEALARTPGRRRNEWLDNYLQRIIERDAPDISSMQRIADLPLVLRILATRNSDEFNATDVSSETGIPVSTLQRLVGLLETLYLVQRIPAWSTNLTKRAVSRPKASLLDTGLAARLLNISAVGAGPNAYGETAGHLLEGFVASELRRQLAWADESVQISHFRDRTGSEVDLILETPDGRVAGLEVKATSRVGRSDNKWLSQLRDKLGSRFVGGLILNTALTATPFGDRIAAVPLDILWEA
ncbi:ATP-binding protein [Nocardioides sp. NPDC006273]|uniref:ATP-binding protein n=1 Tax=Nocardioides sp. NPDC006273 TaxID=3155598 RepID=UPI0033A70469